MSKGVAFIFGAAIGVCGGICLSGKAIAHAIESRGEEYRIQRRDTGEQETWTVAWGTKPSTSHMGFAIRTKCKEEPESNETKSTEDSEDIGQDSREQ